MVSGFLFPGCRTFDAFGEGQAAELDFAVRPALFAGQEALLGATELHPGRLWPKSFAMVSLSGTEESPV